MGKSLLSVLAMGHKRCLCILACLSLQITSAILLAEEFNDLEYKQVPNLITAMSGYDVSKSTPYSKDGDKGSLSPIFNPIYTEDGKVILQDFIAKAGEEVRCEKSFSTKTITSYSDYRKEKGSSMEFSAGGSVGASGYGVEAKVGYEYGETKEDREVLDMFKTNQGEIVMTTLSCSVYIVEIAAFIKPVFMENFVNGMGVLANGALSTDPIKKKNNFLMFLENFGTHYQKQTRMGAKMIYEKRFNARSKSKGESDSRSECAKHATSASVGGSYGGVGGSLEGHVDSEKCSDQANSSNDTDNSSDTESKMITIGIFPTDLSKWEEAIKENGQMPLPLHRKLDLINRLFTPRNLEGLMFRNEETGVEEPLNGTLLSNFYVEQYEKEFLAKYPNERSGCGISGSCKIGEICKNDKSSNTGLSCSKKESVKQRFWTGWSNSNKKGKRNPVRECAEGKYVTVLSWREQSGYGFVNLKMNCNDGETSLMNSNIWSKQRWVTDMVCHKGFRQLTGREQKNYGLVNVKGFCLNQQIQLTAGGNYNGRWKSTIKCKENQNIVGVQTREKKGYGIVDFRIRCA